VGRAEKLCYSFVLIVRAWFVHSSCSKFKLMELTPKAAAEARKPAAVLYCPVCAMEVGDPLTCRDCSAVICRRCGTPLENSDELAMG